jgi:mRNA-degrading endonuclease toxin of MazEF toxin-antitoxin module
MKQGDIILLDFDPTKGREQSGYRPALVISSTLYNKKRNMVIVCPITNATKLLRLRVRLDSRTQTQGDIICEQIRTIDLLARKCKKVETLPKDLFKQVWDAVSVIIKPDN